VIKETVDPRRYHGLGIYLDIAAAEINDFLKYDKFELKKIGGFYKVTDLNGALIQFEAAKGINHGFISE
jgi:hypothetical protein